MSNQMTGQKSLPNALGSFVQKGLSYTPIGQLYNLSKSSYEFGKAIPSTVGDISKGVSNTYKAVTDPKKFATQAASDILKDKGFQSDVDTFLGGRMENMMGNLFTGKGMAAMLGAGTLMGLPNLFLNRMTQPQQQPQQSGRPTYQRPSGFQAQNYRSYRKRQ